MRTLYSMIHQPHPWAFCVATTSLALPLMAQELPSPSRQGPVPVEAYLDWGAGISGERVITVSDLSMAMTDPSEPWGRQVQQGADPAKVNLEVLRDLAMTQLEVEAGRVRGFDPGLVESLVDNHFERQVKHYGGPTEFTKTLQALRTTPSLFRARITSDLYRYAWRDSSLGKQPGPTGRISVDRYIRPGYLFSTYEAFAESSDPAMLAVLGGSAEMLVLGRIILPIEQHAAGLDEKAGLEKTKFLAQQLRAQVIEGEATFEAQAAAWDTNRGQGDPMQRTLRGVLGMSRQFHQTDLLFEFARDAKAGDVSPPLPYQTTDGQWAVVLYALTERLPARSPKPFTDLTVQVALRKHLLEELDKRRMTRARLHLVQKSHLHPADLRPFLTQRQIQGR